MKGGAARRSGWALADQALSSGTNFALAVTVARSVTPAGFGAFGLAFTVYTLGLGLSGALVSEPLLVRFSTAGPAELRAAIAASGGAALALGLVLGGVTVVAGAALGGTAAGALVPLGCLFPALLVQDSWRYAFLAAGRPAAAAANDLVWALAQLALVGSLIALHRPTVTGLVLTWALAALVAGVAGCAQIGVVPHPVLAQRWWAEQRDLAPGFAGEFVARAGARQATIAAVGSIGGLVALAGVRGAQVLFGPLNVLIQGAGMVAVPELARLWAGQRDLLLRTVALLAGAMAGFGLASGAAALLVPDSLGRALLGPTWSLVEPVIVPQALLMAGIGASSAVVAGLRACVASRRSLTVRLTVVPVTLLAGLVGAALADAPGAVAGLAAANAFATVLFWAQLRRAVAEGIPVRR